MVVYGTASRVEDPRSALNRLRTPWSEEDAVSVLIELGEIETGIVDALYPDSDGECEISRTLRAASVAAARRSWREMRRQLDRLRRMRLPARIQISKPEGFAYYGLFPEMYLAAAREFERTMRPERVAVIGIRSIGTTLASLVAAGLTCVTRTFTVRPRGHPFDRRLLLDEALEADLCGLRGWTFAIADEGPGLSGSSFACVVRALARIGVAETNIVLFPSWVPDGSAFVSGEARQVWRSLCKFSIPFEGLPDCVDASQGRWLERRKYRLGDRLFKFTGLGPYGRPKLDRARVLARRGFSPSVHGLSRGFLEHTFAAGQPLRRQDRDHTLLRTMRAYIACLQRDFPAAGPVPFDALMEMIAVNAEESLGRECLGRVERLERYRTAVCDGTRVAVDGRMLPHEWIRTRDGYLKTDALDHHDDHFFPGCQDISWDIAGACAEFGLGRAERAYLAAASPRPGLIPFYEAAYLAYRTGYTTMAGRRPARRYARLLREALEIAAA